MKRVFTIIFAIAIIITMQTSVMAQESDIIASPRYSYISAISANLNINKTTGIASCGASGVIDSGDSLVLSCRLQRYNGSTWTTVKTWSTTTARSAVITKNYTVASGYTYRVRVTGSVYNSNGLLVESGNCYSKLVVY